MSPTQQRPAAVVSDILPCPFCGQAPNVVPCGVFNPDKHEIACECDDCDVQPSVTGFTLESAKIRWNYRDPEAAAQVREPSAAERERDEARAERRHDRAMIEHLIRERDEARGRATLLDKALATERQRTQTLAAGRQDWRHAAEVAEARADKAVEVLRRLNADRIERSGDCPCCRAHEDEDHTPDCVLNALLVHPSADRVEAAGDAATAGGRS